MSSNRAAARKFLSLAFFLLSFSAAAQEAKPAAPLRAGIAFGFLAEKGLNYSRLAPATRIGASWAFDLGGFDAEAGASCALGAFFGQIVDFGVEADIAPRWSATWKPSIGIAVFTDLGSTIFFATDAASAASAPPYAMDYAGIALRPLVFVGRSNWELSFLDARVAMGFYGFPRSVRAELSLANIGWRFGK